MSKIAHCKIRIGKHGAKNPVDRMWKSLTKRQAAITWGVDPHRAVCVRCGQEIDVYDDANLHEISCSNCYSDTINLTAIKLWQPTEREIKSWGSES